MALPATLLWRFRWGHVMLTGWHILMALDSLSTAAVNAIPARNVKALNMASSPTIAFAVSEVAIVFARLALV